MDQSVRFRLSYITRPLFFATILVLSLLVYLAENYTGVEADARTAVSQPAKLEAPTTLLTQTNPAYGLNRISNSEQSYVPEAQYQAGLSTGAIWDRWPLYWYNIEQEPDIFNWTYQDTAVKGIVSHGLNLNALLLGTPGFYHTGRPAAQPLQPTPTSPAISPMALDQIQTGVPAGLQEPVFNDDSDIPGPEKKINSDNKWARFVELAVNRYKPGGLIAQEENWSAGVGVTHWEMWNEPDLIEFWDGSVEDYARLLKVGYLVAKHADPNAQVIFGGLADVYSSPWDIPYLTAVLEIYDDDPLAQNYNYFHDITAIHNYSYSYRSWRATFIAQRRLNARNLDNEIWLNESGVSVWDDYPGPVCDPTSPYRSTMLEQADFIIQSALYAKTAGADNIFFFSLYDECGNIGGDRPYFPPDQCASNPPDLTYAGDAFGLFRNPSDSLSLCSTQHPQPGTARPGLAAYQVLTEYAVNIEPIWRARPGVPGSGNGLQEFIAFYQPHTQSRLLGMWALTDEPATAVFNSTHSSQTGLLVGPDGITQTIQATNGVFTVTLPPATSHITPTEVYAGVALMAIGGRPYLVIEQDDLPPEVTITAPPAAAVQVNVAWQGNDLGSHIASYDVTVSENGGAPTSWITHTTAVSGTYPISEGTSYTFTVFGRDQAGNMSSGTSATVIGAVLDNHIYLPTIQK
jgi:hypothetical protein